jgi:hypothetical protein
MSLLPTLGEDSGLRIFFDRDINFVSVDKGIWHNEVNENVTSAS